MTSPDDAVQIARRSITEPTRNLPPSVTTGVLAAYDALATELADLQAALAANEQYQLGEAAGIVKGQAIADEEHAKNPTPPAKAPPRKAPTRAMEALQAIKDDVIPRAFRTRLETDKPGEPASGPRVVRVDWLRAAVNPKTDTEPAPPAPAR